ncbi:MAG: 3-phosphoshikimate 1-carboxyvinyltransferase, partial [Fusobacterium sp.]|nr:3-phosphoshikimate 1-carboxyvinyltransferase [Fusobacterium sp.]
ENNGYQNIKICGSQKYEAQNVEIESDFSQAAFFIVANSLGSKLDIENCNKFSLQGDKEIISLVEKVDNFNGEELIIDGSNCPDIIPIFSLKAAYSNKKVKITNVGRLRIKECDRLKATVEELSKFGFDLEEEKDSIVINYREKTQLKTEKILASSHNDHRIAMMLAIVSTVYQGEIILDNADCVKKSYPDFWEVFSSIGGKFNECLGE